MVFQGSFHEVSRTVQECFKGTLKGVASNFNPPSEGVQILWVGGGGASKAPPKKSMTEWAETPCCYRHIVKV